MPWPVVIAANGFGIPVTESDSELAIPAEIADNGYGTPVVLVDSGGTPVKGVGVSWLVSTPTIAVVEPVTNPPAFDIGLDIAAPGEVQIGDVIRLRIDGNTTHDSDPLDAADLLAGTVEIANGTLAAGSHTADVAVFRSAVQVSDWSAVDTFDVPSGYETESQTIFAAFTTPPDDTRKGHIDDFVSALKSAGIWTKLDALYVFAAADSQAALINWKAPGTFDASAVGSPTFTADQGFAGNGSSSYIDSNFVPSTAGGQYTQNSAHVSARSRSELTGAGSNRIIGNVASTGGRSVFILRTAANVTTLLLNDATGFNSGTVSTTVGHYLINRSGGSATKVYKDGTSISTGTIASNALPSQSITFDRDTTNYATFQVASGSIGASLDSTEAAALAAAELVYMQAVGAV